MVGNVSFIAGRDCKSYINVSRVTRVGGLICRVLLDTYAVLSVTLPCISSLERQHVVLYLKASRTESGRFEFVNKEFRADNLTT